MTTWLHGIAPVVGITGRTIRIQCPHCGHRHTHGRNMAGSRHILAGCHTGHTRCREYAIPDLPARPQPTQPQHDPTRGKGVTITTTTDPGQRRRGGRSLPPAESSILA